MNSGDFLSLNRALAAPPRGIGEKSFALIRDGKKQLLSPRALSSYNDFMNKILSIKETSAERSLAEIVRLVISKFNLEEYYRDGTPEGEDRYENAKELITVAAKFNNLAWPDALVDFLSEVALYSDTDEIGKEKGVTLMTLHQAKGLEFDNVFIVGLEEGLLPHMKTLESGGDVGEEIRLAYVGMTRARKKLHLLNARVRRIFGGAYTLKPSRVLRPIPEELVEHRS